MTRIQPEGSSSSGHDTFFMRRMAGVKRSTMDRRSTLELDDAAAYTVTVDASHPGPIPL